MTKQETVKLLALISSAYKREFSALTEEELNVQASLWYEAFANDPAEDVARAVKDYIFTDKTGFAPSIGKIREVVKPQKRPIETYPSFKKTVREFMADYALYGADCLVKDKSQLVPKLEGRTE